MRWTRTSSDGSGWRLCQPSPELSITNRPVRLRSEERDGYVSQSATLCMTRIAGGMQMRFAVSITQLAGDGGGRSVLRGEERDRASWRRADLQSRGATGGGGSKPVPEFTVQYLLRSPTVTIRDVCCQGSSPHPSAEECATATQLVFPYRGVYVRHLGHDQAVAEATQVLFFNATEGYRVTHPVPGGDACLTLAISEAQLRELAPLTFLRDGATLAFRHQRLRIDARAQALVALLRHSLRQNIAEPLEAESLALTLVQRALGAHTTHAAGASVGRRRLVDRAKLVLASDPARRWTLAEIAAEGPGSPVYLTQAFQQVEGLPLYRYQLRLRLARALELLALYDDLTALSLDLGFSSHSHFSAAFRKLYGRSPSEFRQAALRR